MLFWALQRITESLVDDFDLKQQKWSHCVRQKVTS